MSLCGVWISSQLVNNCVGNAGGFLVNCYSLLVMR